MGFEPAYEHPYIPHMDQGFEFHRPWIEEDGQAHVKVKHINYDFTKLRRFQVCEAHSRPLPIWSQKVVFGPLTVEKPKNCYKFVASLDF